MQFGLFMMPLHPPHRALADGYDRDLDQIVLAEQLGFEEAWLGEHFTERWENAPAPDLQIARALALTRKIRLGTGVTLLGLHQPVYLAHRLAMLDHMARGRFQWGIGGGGIPTDLALLGIDPNEVRERSAEVLEVVLSLWACDGKFEHKGRFFNIDAPLLDPLTERGLHMKPYQQPHPPIAVAASTPQSTSMRMAGERGWMPMSSSLLSSNYLPNHWTMVEEGAAKAGLQPSRSDWRVARDIYVAPSTELARKRAREVLGRNYLQHQLPSRKGTWQMAAAKIDPDMSDDAMDVDYMMENVWIVGDPVECAQKIEDLYGKAGGFGRLLSITADADDPEWDRESLTLLMHEVAPRLAHLN
ncbi:MAG: LLM class flavin-dependent oxidoreductase [Gammaproteobacteria bacterium]|nr:LLM class flavin-dependent oxidoreductase [Gammaproteobacteria bacterium]